MSTPVLREKKKTKQNQTLPLLLSIFILFAIQQTLLLASYLGLMGSAKGKN